MEKIIKEIDAKTVLYFFVGISLGLLIVLLIKQIKLVKKKEMLIDNIKEEIATWAEVEKIKDEIKKVQKEKEPEKNIETEKSVFPLKKGSNCLEVNQLHGFLIETYGADIDEEELAEATFGQSTLNAVTKYLKRDTISERYYNKAIA